METLGQRQRAAEQHDVSVAGQSAEVAEEPATDTERHFLFRTEELQMFGGGYLSNMSTSELFTTATEEESHVWL